MPAVKAGAIEVAASTNGQLMPPIMGAAAFIIAEFIGVTYFDVVKAAFIPAAIAYIALIYISHLEALKLGLRGLPAVDIPPLVQDPARRRPLSHSAGDPRLSPDRQALEPAGVGLLFDPVAVRDRAGRARWCTRCAPAAAMCCGRFGRASRTASPA